MRTITTPDPKPSTAGRGRAAIAALIWIPINAIIGGLVVRYLYHRLMVPTFPTLPPHIGIAAAIGLSVFVGYMTLDESSLAKINDDPRSFAEKQAAWLTVRVLIVVVALVVGWFM